MDRDELVRNGIVEMLGGICLAYENDPDNEMFDIVRDRIGANSNVYYSLAAIYDVVREFNPEDPEDPNEDDTMWCELGSID